MGRKPAPRTNTEPIALVNEEAFAEGRTALAQLTAIKEGLSDERDLLNQLLGQAQMADAFAQFSRTVRTSKLAFVRENKLYRALKGKQGANGSQFSGTWEEFCELLGTSRDKVELDIANLKTFGEEALDSMSRMGIGYRELRQFRKLPDDQRTALIEVAKTGNKEDLQELAEELISKAQAEKDKAQADAGAAVLACEAEVKKAKAEAKADLDAKERRITTLRDQLNEKEEQLAAFQTKGIPADQRLADFSDDITKVGRKADDHLAEVANMVAVIEQYLTDLFDPDNPKDFDRNNAILLAQRTRDQVWRLGRNLGRAQALIETSIYPLIEAEEMYLPYTAEDGQVLGDELVG